MKTPRFSDTPPQGAIRASRRSCWPRLLGCLLILGAITTQAGSFPNAGTPASFFTNVVDRLLRAQGYPFGVTGIPVFTNNTFVYTPSVQRLLQLAANLYDSTTNRLYQNATTNPFLPTVFQPRFGVTNGNVYITDFKEVTDLTFLQAGTFRDLVDSNLVSNLGPYDLVFGVPLIIGAKKGFPNFNEFSMQSVFEITRRAQLTRPSVNADRSLWRTNVMFVLSVSNAFGVEAWNSYRTNYTRPVTIYVTNMLAMAFTNDAGLRWTLPPQQWPGTAFSIPNATSTFWPGIGYSSYPNLTSFVVPMNTNMMFIPSSVYHYSPPSLTPVQGNDNFEIDPNGFSLPRWGLSVTNRLIFIMVDTLSGRVIDYVHLTGLNGIRDLASEIADPDYAIEFAGLWSTNRLGGTNANYAYMGLLNQLMVCLDPANGTADWTSYGNAPSQSALTSFRNFYNRNSQDTDLTCQVPFSPIRIMSQYLTWQANDPLVHYTASDLSDLAIGNGLSRANPKMPLQLLPNLGVVNDHYSPWGGNVLKTGGDPASDPSAFDIALKDPWVTTSDDWDFPTAQPLSLATLGRIHRGTPWQTVYLKSADIITGSLTGLQTWMSWCGDTIYGDAQMMAPTNDWRLVSVLGPLLNPTAPQLLLSVNDPNTNSWLAALNGLQVLTNTSANPSFLSPPQFDTLTMSGGSWQAAVIASAIQAAKARQPGGYFLGLGDLLSVPELSLASPWLNMDYYQQQWGITDEAYEAIPSQLLARLRPDSIGSLTRSGGTCQVQFTGIDGYAYAVQVSSNLHDWIYVSLSYPTYGLFYFVETPPPAAPRRFYRSILLP